MSVIQRLMSAFLNLITRKLTLEWFSTVSTQRLNIIVGSARDTDITVFLLTHFDNMECETLCLKSGTSKKPKYIPIHEIRRTLALEQSVLDTMPLSMQSLDVILCLFFQAIQKKTSWDVFLEHHKLLEPLGKSEALSEEGARMAEAFICRIFKVPYDSCDKDHVHLFCKSKPPEALPSTSDAVQLHIQRANYQTFIWKQVDMPVPVM